MKTVLCSSSEGHKIYSGRSYTLLALYKRDSNSSHLERGNHVKILTPGKTGQTEQNNRFNFVTVHCVFVKVSYVGEKTSVNIVHRGFFF